ncbi:hypothetical protein IAT38_001051 [Cryptococcus sp. DSM 104549]
MLHASTPSPPPHTTSAAATAAASGSSSPQPSPASLFIQRLHTARSGSYDSGLNHGEGSNGPARSGAAASRGAVFGIGGVGGSPAASAAAEGEGGAEGVRRATSLRAPGVFGGGVRGELSFGQAGSNLGSPTPSNASVGGGAGGSTNGNGNGVYTPPAASRHPLFSHHAQPPQSQINTTTYNSIPSPSFLSDPGPSGPPSPTISDLSSGFSPASAFLSHFSSAHSLRGVNLAPDAQGARVLEYTLGKLVGRGGFSTVRKALHVTTGETFACKIVKRDDLSDRSGSLEKFEEEIRMWRELPRHPSLLPLLDMHRTPFATFLFMPYLPGGSLLDVLQREGGSDKTARKWFAGVVAAVSALHDGFEGFPGGILHGDLKLDNFLVDHAGRVMVCDFYMAQKINGAREEDRLPTIPPPLTAGVGRHSTLPSNFSRGSTRGPSPYRSGGSHSHHGHHRANEHHMPESASPALPAQPFPSASLPYAPPELLRAPPSGPSLAQDIWAVGIILHALLTGRLPFVDAFDPRLQMKILRGSWEEPPDLGREWSECLRGCLDGNREKRWTIKRVRESDAVLGWTEVKSRSKSRSRSRARGVGEGLLDSRRRDGFGMAGMGLGTNAQPVPIASPNHRSRVQSRDRGASLGSGFHADSHNPTPRDPFALLPPREDVSPSGLHSSSKPRSRSASASRSRSSGHGHRSMFVFDAPELAKGLEAVDMGRGRSTRRGAPPGTIPSLEMSPAPATSTPGLTYARTPGSSNQGLPIPVPSGSYSSRSRSQSANRSHPQSAPAQSSGFRNVMAMGFASTPPVGTPPMHIPLSRQATPGSQAGGLGQSQGTGRSRSRSSKSSTSPSVSRGPRSLSRPGDSPGWDIAPERYEYGKGLGAVHEHGDGEREGRSSGVVGGRGGEPAGEERRSRSRGRRGRLGAPGGIGGVLGDRS